MTYFCMLTFFFFIENIFLSHKTHPNHSFPSHNSFQFPLTSPFPQIYFPSIPFIKDQAFKRQQQNTKNKIQYDKAAFLKRLDKATQ